MSRVVIVSSDGHAGIERERYRDYIDARYHRDFDQHLQALATIEANEPAAFAEEVSEERERVAAKCNFMDPAGRLSDLEANGVSAEVLFPGASPATSVPWSDFLTIGTYRPRNPRDRELQWVGERAYNRWLAEFCSHAPTRHLGLAFVPYHDVDAAVREIHWAAENQLRGVLLPHFNYDLPEYCINEYWEPIWSALDDTGLSINCHGGYGLADYGRHQVLVGLENTFYSPRPMCHMIFSGVFDRHPGLGIAITEAFATWVPEVLTKWDAVYESSRAGLANKGALWNSETAARKPSEYWAENCFVGVSLVSFAEMAQRHAIGVGTMMYGLDYPHPEGNWGQYRTWMQASIGRAGVPDWEARMMLGENAARLYRLDLSALQSVADRVGPTMEEVLASASEDAIEDLLADVESSGRAIASVNYHGAAPHGGGS
jgi:predicted TIM-barrel fold metal-dependent hydrolase